MGFLRGYQRTKNRINKIGLSCAKIIKVEELVITVQGLDAVNGTPLLDIKPVYREFFPSENTIIQPNWVSELMTHYYD